MKKLIFAFFLVVSIRVEAVVVFLRGAACTGKTSLGRALTKRDKRWRVVDSDSLLIARFSDLLKTNFPKKYAIIAAAIAEKNIFNAVRRYDILFKDNFSEQERINATRAIIAIRKVLDNRENKLYEYFIENLVLFTKQKIRDFTSHGYNVLVDAWGFDADYYDFHRKRGALFVGVYCPFDVVVQRFFQRNNKAHAIKDLRAKRLFYHTLSSFNNLFIITDNANEGFDVLTKKQVVVILEKILRYLARLNPPNIPQLLSSRREMSVPEFREYEHEILEKFTAETMYVAFRDDFDFTIRTDRYTPGECAQMLLDWVRGKIS